jgi:hypothetical protein
LHFQLKPQSAVTANVLQEAAVLGSDARANGMLDQTDLRWRDRS